MKNPFENREIWFLTGSQELYGEDVLRQVAKQSQEVAARLDQAEAIPVKIVWKEVLKGRDEITSTILAANQEPACVGVIAWMHTFSPAKMWINGLDALQKPLLSLSTQAGEHIPWAEIDMDFMNLNQSAHGDREFGYITSRMQIPRTVMVGHTSQPELQERVGSWARAAVGQAELKTMRVCRFGDNMRDVAVTEGDKVEFERQFGPSINTWPVNELSDKVDAVTDAEVAEVLAAYDAEYDVAPELQPGGERRADLEYGARLEAGMRAFLEEGGFTAFTTNFQDLGKLRQLPGLAVQRLMAEGYGFGAEGDWKTAILVRLAKVMGYGRDGGASLMEDYCYEMEPGKQKILGSHMLEICPSLTSQKPRLEIHPLGIGDREDPVRLIFDTDKGPALVISMQDMRDRLQLLMNEIDVVGPDAPMPNLPVANAVWEPKPNFQTAVECWLYAGGAHHTVLTTNTTREEWEMFARMSNNELLVIDADTTTRNFMDTIRLNDLHFKLQKFI